MKTTYTQTDGVAIEVRDGLAIEVRDLRKTYGGVEAVREVSFEVARGEVFCLLGPNGAGKTSIVEILEGYRTRNGGEARVLGMDPAHGQRELHERVGIVLQQCGVQNDLTVAELLEMYGRYHARRRPVDELIELVELGDKRDTRARKLSGGQLRRLDLALALVGDPTSSSWTSRRPDLTRRRAATPGRRSSPCATWARPCSSPRITWTRRSTSPTASR